VCTVLLLYLNLSNFLIIDTILNDSVVLNTNNNRACIICNVIKVLMYRIKGLQDFHNGFKQISG
jgi:hypothetical protein